MLDNQQFDDEILGHLREVELMIFKDFIKICEKHDLEYYAYGGTALGAVRHGGFIPWDDDIDVLFLREDYEKFLEISKNYSNKYDFINSDSYEDYFSMSCKMSLKGTKRNDFWAKNSSFNLGIHIDIFALDFAPSNKFRWFIYYEKCQLLKKFGRLLTMLNMDAYTTQFRKFIGKTIEKILGLFNISNDSFNKFYKNFVKKTNSNDEMLFDLGAICYNKPFPKDIFRPPKRIKFESIHINVPNDVDKFLTITFGDYMELPPEDERHYHFCEEIDFGEY